MIYNTRNGFIRHRSCCSRKTYCHLKALKGCCDVIYVPEVSRATRTLLKHWLTWGGGGFRREAFRRFRGIWSFRLACNNEGGGGGGVPPGKPVYLQLLSWKDSSFVLKRTKSRKKESSVTNGLAYSDVCTKCVYKVKQGWELSVICSSIYKLCFYTFISLFFFNIINLSIYFLKSYLN